MAAKKCLFFTAAAKATALELADVVRLEHRGYAVGVRNGAAAVAGFYFGTRLEAADAIACVFGGTIPSVFTDAISDYPDGDVTMGITAKAEAVKLIKPTSAVSITAAQAAVTALASVITTAKSSTTAANGTLQTDVDAAVGVLVADGVAPTQGHVNTLNTAWGLLKTAIALASTNANLISTTALSTALALIVPGSLTMVAGSKLQLVCVKADLTENETNTVALTDVTASSTTYASSDEAKATVDGGGIVTAVAAGSAVITATHTYASGKTETATVSVTVS